MNFFYGKPRRSSSIVNPLYCKPVVYQLSALSKHYGQGDQHVECLRNVNLQIGIESISITGRNGSGKSTLLNLLAGLDQPSHGVVHFEGCDIGGLKWHPLAAYRQRIAYIRQDLNLFRDLTVLDNVAFGLTRSGWSLSRAREEASVEIDHFGISTQTTRRFPDQLSGGQRQRCAIARSTLAVRVGMAVAILADEPTASIDADDVDSVFANLLSVAKQYQVPLVVVTHENQLAQMTDRQIRVHRGRLLEETPSQRHPTTTTLPFEKPNHAHCEPTVNRTAMDTDPTAKKSSGDSDPNHRCRNRIQFDSADIALREIDLESPGTDLGRRRAASDFDSPQPHHG